MAQNLRISFDAKKKEFVFAKGPKVDVFRPQYVEADNWKCKIRSDGSIDCRASEERNGKYYDVHFFINARGKVTMTKMKDGIRQQVTCRPIGKWPIDGMLILDGGIIEDRKAFFKRSAKTNKEET